MNYLQVLPKNQIPEFKWSQNDNFCMFMILSIFIMWYVLLK